MAMKYHIVDSILVQNQPSKDEKVVQDIMMSLLTQVLDPPNETLSASVYMAVLRMSDSDMKKTIVNTFFLLNKRYLNMGILECKNNVKNR